jgi:thioredoxin-related protein
MIVNFPACAAGVLLIFLIIPDMKTVLFILASSLLFYSGDWLSDFDQAKQVAKESNKLILLSFSGSDWCGPCIKMKKDVFDKPEFQDFANQHLVLVRADFPRNKKNQLDAKQREHNERLAEQYNSKGKFPLTVLLDANGKVLYEWDGYQGKSASEFVNELINKGNGK